MKLKKITPVINVIEWRGDNLEEVKVFLDNNEITADSSILRYCGVAFAMKGDLVYNNNGSYESIKKRNLYLYERLED